jgi:hypothetical protein|tara:strand:+ start:110 stop:1039 length:930 start_codon:yes stop_codon:yes gene_type:complete
MTIGLYDQGEYYMANTSFVGPVRSKNNYKLYSTTASTGVEHDRTLGTTAKDARRVYLEEWFKQRPGLNANIDQAYTVEVARALNVDWEALGTNMTTALCTFATTGGGVLATTAGADQDQAILTPHLDTAATAWAGTLWGTENSVHFETSLQLPALDNQKVWAGLKLTNDQLIATDDNQMFFKFQSDATNSESLTTLANWHFVHSIGGTDYISRLPIAVEADTPYHFKIEVDSDRKAAIFVNGVQYNVTTTSGSTGGTAVTAVQPGVQATKTAALTNDVDLIPYIGIEAGAAAAEAVNCHYVACSRNVYE